MENNLSIFLLHFSTNVLINFDHGIIPACTTDLKLDLGIDDVEVILFNINLIIVRIYGIISLCRISNWIYVRYRIF